MSTSFLGTRSNTYTPSLSLTAGIYLGFFSHGAKKRSFHGFAKGRPLSFDGWCGTSEGSAPLYDEGILTERVSSALMTREQEKQNHWGAAHLLPTPLVGEGERPLTLDVPITATCADTSHISDRT